MPPQLFAIVASAINLVEVLFPQAKMGPTKLGAVLRITQTVATILAQSGVIPDGAVHDNLAWIQYVQGVFDQSPLAHGSMQVASQDVPQLARYGSDGNIMQQSPMRVNQGRGVSDAVRRALSIGNQRGLEKKGE